MSVLQDVGIAEWVLAWFFIKNSYNSLEYYLTTKNMAAKKIKIELLQDIAHLGRKWDIIEVSSGQARNALIPQKKAIELTPERIKKIESDKKRAQDQARMRLEQAFDIQKKIDGGELEFSLKWKWDKIFGGLAEHEIWKAVQQKWGVHFEKKDIRLPNKAHIKTVGKHLVYLHITHDTIAKIFIHVSIDNG